MDVVSVVYIMMFYNGGDLDVMVSVLSVVIVILLGMIMKKVFLMMRRFIRFRFYGDVSRLVSRFVGMWFIVFVEGEW